MSATALRRPVGHDDRLTVVEHLDELRTRLVICVLALVVAFGVCLWQNGPLLKAVNRPLDRETQHAVENGRGPLGQTALAQDAVKRLAAENTQLTRILMAPDSGLSAATRAQLAGQLIKVRQAVARLPRTPPGNKPVTLGVGEPFSATLTVTFLFALLLSMPVILYQLYAFVTPAFTPKERRVALPLLLMVPVLFIAGVAFGYFLVLPAAVRFLQNFNADQFNVLVQARDYYHFEAITLLACGVVFQMPVGILALTRLGVISVRTLTKNRRYALVIIAVIAMLLPGTDPVSMLIEMGPLVILYELGILLTRLFVRNEPAVVDDDPGDEDDDDPGSGQLHAV